MPPLTTVTTVTSTGEKVALCSCGWEGTRTSTPAEAYRERQRHSRDEHDGQSAPARSTATQPPGGETRA